MQAAPGALSRSKVGRFASRRAWRSKETTPTVSTPSTRGMREEHDQWMTVPNLYVDEYPVTCARFAAFLNETGYWPEDDVSFLEGWNGKQYPTGYGNKPVTSVSRLDAKAFCASRGMQLPETWEWQYAAQGTGGRDYPWGMDDDPARYPL